MTARELSILLNAKSVRRGAWMAKCPIHREKTASLSIRDMGNRMSVKCFGCGATGSQIMKALGLHPSDLFVDQRVMTPEIRERLKDENRLQWLESRRLDCIANLYFWEPDKRHYWAKAEQRVRAAIQELRDKLHPEGKVNRERREKLDRFLRKHGWDKLWDLWLTSEKGSVIAEQYGVH